MYDYTRTFYSFKDRLVKVRDLEHLKACYAEDGRRLDLVKCLVREVVDGKAGDWFEAEVAGSVYEMGRRGVSGKRYYEYGEKVE